MSQDEPRFNRIQLLRTQLWACAGEEAYREAVRLGAPRSREAVPVVDVVHEPPAAALATLISLLEQDRFETSVLLMERGLDRAGTPFIHHENATAALGAVSTALYSRPARNGGVLEQRALLHELLGVWLLAAVAGFPEAHEGYLRDLARGMGPWMIPQGWGATLLRSMSGAGAQPEGLVVALMREAVVHRAPGLKLRTVRHALEALDVSAEAHSPQLWRRALAFVVGEELHQVPQGRLYAEYQAHLGSPASRYRRVVDFIEREAIPTYLSVRD